MKLGLKGGYALDAPRYLLAAALAAVSLAEIYYRCRLFIFSPDEVHNLDPILTFFRKADYTSISQGPHRFDPVLSSGILATWLNGAVYVAGGSLFLARLVTALAQFGLAVYLAYRLLRARGITAPDALVIALGTWTTLILVGGHYLRITNAGEMWGFLYLAAGCLFVERSPRLAAFVWGLGTWLAKLIYLPFSGLLVAALALAGSLQRRHPQDSQPGFVRRLLTSSARLGLAFLAPLLLWMALIALRYDLATLVHWAGSYVTFIAKHSADVGVTQLPIYDGWFFNPDWRTQPLFAYTWRGSLSYLGPIEAAALSFVVYFVLRLFGWVRSDVRETLLLVAASLAVMLGVVWFFAFDPTQWGRHLMPAIYVSVAIALYCAAEIYKAAAKRRLVSFVVLALMYAAVLSGSYYAYGAVRAYAATDGWKLSYSKTCRGTNVLAPPCHNGDTLKLIDKLAKEWCGPDAQAFSPTDYCKVNNRRRFIEHAIEILADPEAPEQLVHTGGYLLILMQAYDYDSRGSFLEDLGPAVCKRSERTLRQRLNDVGVDEDTLSEACAPRSSSSQSGTPPPFGPSAPPAPPSPGASPPPSLPSPGASPPPVGSGPH